MIDDPDSTFGPEDADEWTDERHHVIASFECLTPCPWWCAACGEWNETLLDLQGGLRQQYVEDCSICCRPNLLRVIVEPSSLAVTLSNDLEYH